MKLIIEITPITLEQVKNMAGNILEVRADDEKKLLWLNQFIIHLFMNNIIH